jgi:RNA polymerase sigma-70 factor (ECF subfamily)
MDMPTTTLDLIERFRRGDREAFTPLFDKYRRRLAVMIHYKLRPEKRQIEDVEEILQDTFCAAFEDLQTFEYRAPGSFLNWLSRIADHVIIDSARRENRLKRRAQWTRFRSASNPDGANALDSRSPSRVLREQEELEALLAKLNSLPEHYRQVILLAKIEGLSTKEMSDRLGKPRESVALLLHRAIQRLRELRDSE